MPRPKLLIPKTPQRSPISEDIHKRVRLRLKNPVWDKLTYGSWSGLIEKLLRQWEAGQPELTNEITFVEPLVMLNPSKIRKALRLAAQGDDTEHVYEILIGEKE